MKLLGIFLLVLSTSYGIGITNYQSSIQTEKIATKNMILKKEKEVMDQARSYKTNLESKREAMKQLLHKLKGIEIIMKSNQIKRKKITKHWNEFYSSQKKEKK